MTTPPTPRPALQALPVYKPGRSAEVAMRDHDLEHAVKLASNENPFAPLPSVLEAIDRSASEALNRYADHRAEVLRAALAARLGVTAEQIAVGCGSVGLLQQIVLAFVERDEEVIYGWRSFEAYPIYSTIVGATQIQVPNRFQALDMAGIAAAVTDRTRLVLVTSPNNPTGTVVGHDELAALLDAVPADCLVVLDEAYYEYVTGQHAPDALALAAVHPHFAVLRTFSKAYGLAGLRIGYGFGAPDLARTLWTMQLPFGISITSAVAVAASFDAESQLRQRIRLVTSERRYLWRRLRSMGIYCTDSHANFLYLPAAGRSWRQEFDVAGVRARHYADGAARVTVGGRASTRAILDALAQGDRST